MIWATSSKVGVTVMQHKCLLNCFCSNIAWRLARQHIELDTQEANPLLHILKRGRRLLFTDDMFASVFNFPLRISEISFNSELTIPKIRKKRWLCGERSHITSQ